MNKFQLGFGLHNHQPVGNFDHVIEEAHNQAYEPFCALLKEFPSIRMSLHQSGILWNWQQRNHPEYADQIRMLVNRDQVELMTGGFYEPILIAVPQRDAVGQIGMLTEYLANEFSVEAEGLWLTERIWEPHLPRLLAEANVKYLPVDDTHFLYAGFDLSQLTGPFVTESEGKAVTLLPIQKRLRYLIPFGTVEDLIAELKSQAERNPDGMAVYADDGEKFGVWPGTHQHCFTDGWLRDCFEAFEQNSDWLEVTTLGELSNRKAEGRAYLPSSSYEEMLQWSLPADSAIALEKFDEKLKESGLYEKYGRFVRGGHWRGFLTKYDESNLMQKRMLRLSYRLDEFEKSTSKKGKETESVRKSLYASQCNCAYWHGVFGGLYLPHLRQAIYSSIIEGEYKLNQSAKRYGLNVEEYDFDADGHNEIIISNNEMTSILRPSIGGTLVEFSLDRHHFSLTDTLSRRREAYHYKLSTERSESNGTASIHDSPSAKEEGLEKLLLEDWYLKRCFIDHFLSDDTTPEDFASADFEDIGDFVLEPYEATVENKGRSVRMARVGSVRLPSGLHKLEISKHFKFDEESSGFSVKYVIRNLSENKISLRFAVENNFSFQAGHAEDRYILLDGMRPDESYLDSMGSVRDAFACSLVDEYRQLAVMVASETPAEIWHSPIHTVSLSESGFEKVYQGTTVVHLQKLEIGQGKEVELSFTVSAGAISEVVSAMPAVVENS